MQLTIEYAEVKALIRLLDDPDREVYTTVSDRLVNIGNAAVPLLEQELHQGPNPVLMKRIETVLDRIVFQRISEDLLRWRNENSHDLLQGISVIQSIEYPYLQWEAYRAEIDRLRKDVWIELNERLTSLEKTIVLNHILLDVYQFNIIDRSSCNAHELSLPYLLSERRSGDIMFAILYKILADSLEYPVVPIGLPDHFVLGYKDVHSPKKDDMLFYIDPFRNGAVFGKKEFQRYLNRVFPDKQVDRLRPCNNIAIVSRLLHSLNKLFLKEKNHIRSQQMHELMSILNNDNNRFSGPYV